MNKKYKDTIDPKSAFEMLEEKMNTARKEQEEVQQQKEEEKAVTKTSTSSRKEKSTFDEVLSSPVTKQIGRELVRGVFGMLFGTTTRRTTTRRKY
jgi:lipid II:glycine glycyltransferase (peptidoglycan interpeptide bridge formation enzyme)